MSRYELLHGDCLEKLKGLPDNSVDAIVTDPPAGIAFMGRSWDEDKGGRREWIAWLASVMGECLRVLKPGGHAFVWALPRTSHWTATALEDAGFEVRDCIVHCFASGFPKSANISKMIDKMKGAEREVVGSYTARGFADESPTGDGRNQWAAGHVSDKIAEITIPATPEAAQWEGFGSALKPATEHWWLCRKPLTGTIAANVLEWGTGGLHIDACRVGFQSEADKASAKPQGATTAKSGALAGGTQNDRERTTFEASQNPTGRFPPNVLFSHLPECRQVGTKVEETVEAWECADGCAVRQLDEQSGICPGMPLTTRRKGIKDGAMFNPGADDASRSPGYGDSGGASRFFPTFQHGTEEYECADGCPVKELDEQSGTLKSGDKLTTHKRHSPRLGHGGAYGDDEGTGYPRDWKGDSGGASRFFPAFRYQAKAPPKERKVEGVEGQHPTQKPEALCRWLVRLVTPPNGVVLDPFTGSGTTGVAALLEGFRFIGCEREDEYYAIAKARLDNAEKQQHGKQSTLFDLEAS